MVKRIVVWAGLVVMVLVAACGDDDADTPTQSPATTQATTTTTEAVQALQPGPVTSFEDIAGTYERQGPGEQAYLHFFEDGTINRSVNRGLIVDRAPDVFKARFEETKAFLKTIKGSCPVTSTSFEDIADHPDAIYEVRLLENGNLQLVAVGEDTCAHRASGWRTAEWAPVP